MKYTLPVVAHAVSTRRRKPSEGLLGRGTASLAALILTGCILVHGLAIRTGWYGVGKRTTSLAEQTQTDLPPADANLPQAPSSSGRPMGAAGRPGGARSMGDAMSLPTFNATVRPAESGLVSSL